MRAVVIERPSAAGDGLRVAEVAEPRAGPDDLLVRVAYGGLNFADLMMRHGTYPHPRGYPLVAGIELAGEVEAVGEHVESFAVGDRVVAFPEGAGAFAERCAVPAARAVKLPDAIGLDVGAAFLIQAMTAYFLLHEMTDTRPGDTLLVHAAGGGVGLYVTQLATLAAADVIGTVGTPGKQARPRAFGAVEVVDRNTADFVDVALARTGGAGVDKVVDSTGASILDRSFAALRPFGHVLSYGEAEGRPLPNLWERLVANSLTFTRFHLGHVDTGDEIFRRDVAHVLHLITSERLAVPIEAVHALDDARAMYDRLASRTVSGKLLLKVDPR
jgi:NADPH2:quinone reductase